MMSVDLPGEQRPMVTRAEYEQARAVLEALPPGVYLKCGTCEGWWRGGSITYVNGSSEVVCERCSA